MPLPLLNRALVESAAFQARTDVGVPAPVLLDLPERAVQFGTGAFLRGFVEPFLDAANRAGRFGGRVVMVGSTGSGRDRVLAEQDGLFTLSVQGIQDGEPVHEQRVIGSVSRALSAVDEWDAVLACARNPLLELVFSNTTEVGIVLDEDDQPDLAPPRSFPGKLTRFLYERATAFGFDPARGVVVLPCELIEDNGDKLRAIVLRLAERWHLDARFAAWIASAVPFCNTLVDRIVPGTPAPDARAEAETALGYRDALLTVAEAYCLFVIQGDETMRARLPFADVPGVAVTEDVAPYRLRKVRMLNGAHTITVPTAVLCGCETVLDAVRHPMVGPFLRRAMLDEIVPTVDAPGGEAYARAVLDRFANPYVQHALRDISLQQTMKMRVRVVPSIVRNGVLGRVPESLAFGFAAYLRMVREGLGLADDQADRVRAHWAACDAAEPELASAVCADAELWGADLSTVPGFTAAVAAALTRMRTLGVEAALEQHLAAGATA
ncbi:tagaturonate reductase [Longimicrobium sp.]|uniref:tagaturonate reductase n=1 Tax=Longimicrobium sp. TaxID=2029185 RepID=UPI002E2F33A1|nr:tagaturonate reductase [Longimicrobium sp.]HEX6036899.1 tagaturonate reductase [Longimicrobium sp.]